MAFKAGFFSNEGALGIGYSTKDNLLANFGTTSIGNDDIRLLVGDNNNNDIIEISNNHLVRFTANTSWFTSDGFYIRGLNNSQQQSFNQKVFIKCNGDIDLHGSLNLVGNKSGSNAVGLLADNSTDNYSLIFPAGAPDANNKVIVYNASGVGEFVDFSSGGTLQEIYSTGTTPDKGKITMDNGNPMFFSGSSLIAGEELLIISSESTISSAETGDRMILRSVNGDNSNLAFEFNGYQFTIETNNVTSINSNSFSITTTLGTSNEIELNGNTTINGDLNVRDNLIISSIEIPDSENNALEIKDSNGNILMNFNTSTGQNDAAVTIHGNLIVDATGGSGGYVSATEYNTLSDKNFKENIESINPMDAQHMIERMRGVSWNWKEECGFNRSDKKVYGVIAQELEEVMPEAVSTSANGVKTVSYNQLFGVVIEAIKNIQAQVFHLSSKINS